MDPIYEQFKQKVLRKTGLNLSLYKEKQMKRRIESLSARNGFKDLLEYFDALNKDKDLFQEFINYLTINVSEFFRNPQQWKIIENDIFPSIIKKKNNIKVWSAACSTGEEPYTITMILSRFLPLNKIRIHATDIDLGAMDKAKKGIYNKTSLKNMPKELIQKYFTEEDAKTVKISDEIKKCVNFTQHNLLKDRYNSGFDVIICRNVMIYFTEEAKSEIYQKFSDALVDDGVLFVGSTEQIISPQNYGLQSGRTFFYEKISK